MPDTAAQPAAMTQPIAPAIAKSVLPPGIALGIMIGIALTVGVLLIVGAAAGAYWALHGRDAQLAIMRQEAENAAIAAAARAAEQKLQALAKSQASSEGVATASAPVEGEVAPVVVAAAEPPVSPAAAAALAAQAAEAERLRAEAEQDRIRHEKIEAEIALRAKQQAADNARAALEEARRKLKIEMYSALWCHNCRIAEAYLRASSIRYDAHDIDRDPGARDIMRRLNPRRSVPTFKIDDEVVVGFNEANFERAMDRAARKRIGML